MRWVCVSQHEDNCAAVLRAAVVTLYICRYMYVMWAVVTAGVTWLYRREECAWSCVRCYDIDIYCV